MKITVSLSWQLSPPTHPLTPNPLFECILIVPEPSLTTLGSLKTELSETALVLFQEQSIEFSISFIEAVILTVEGARVNPSYLVLDVLGQGEKLNALLVLSEQG